MNVTAIVFNVLGVIGACLLLFGFYRVNIGKWNNKSAWYELDNFLGALLLVIYQIYYHAFVSVVVNIIWGGVALIGAIAFVRRLHRHRVRRAKHSRA